MSLRFRVLSVVTIASILGTAFLWTFNIFYIVRNWSLFWDGFTIFFMIVVVLVSLSCFILWMMMREVSKVEKGVKEQRVLTEEEDRIIAVIQGKMPLTISLINVFGFLIGPISKHVAAALVSGINPINFTLLISSTFSVAIGVYIAFIEIRLIERIFQPLQMYRKRHSIDQTRRRKWKSRQLITGITIFVLAFGLFFSAGIGYLKEELLAPGNLDSVTAASESVDVRSDLWSRALAGENLNLTESSPGISNRIWEYILKMGLLGLLVLALSLIAISIETKPTVTRLAELNEHLSAIAGGEASKDRKLVILRGDELGQSVHWINCFIDRQANLLETIGISIDGLGDISKELSVVNQNAQGLGKGLEEGIKRVQENLNIQNKALDVAEEDTASLAKNIERTNENLQNQNQAMNSNSAAVEELVANISSVSKNSQAAFERTGNLKEQADKSNQEMSFLLTGIKDLVETADQVNQSIGQIARVAAQTNLLAMNAAIEAAHAGDVGAGFAVVAAEVRTLAEDSGTAAKRITELIKKMNILSLKGQDQAGQAQQSFAEIRDEVTLTSRVISEISMAMQEQEGGSKEMQDAMEQLENLTREVSDITLEQTGQSSHVRDSVKELNVAANQIQGQMEQNIALMGDFERFIVTLSEVIERNSELVKGLESASRKE